MYKDNLSYTEHEYVIRLIDGDEHAFCLLYSRYRDRLLYFAMKFLKSEVLAEDILQDVFANIWMGRKFINPDIPFSSYVYLLVKHRALNELRSMERQQVLRDQILQNSADYCEVTKNEILSNDLKLVLNKAFDAMTPRQREVFRLSREGQLSYKEIADKLGISVHTVHEHITSSLQILRQFLLKYSDAEADLLLLLVIFNS